MHSICFQKQKLLLLRNDFFAYQKKTPMTFTSLFSRPKTLAAKKKLFIRQEKLKYNSIK